MRPYDKETYYIKRENGKSQQKNQNPGKSVFA
jgi:hypothetical protein